MRLTHRCAAARGRRATPWSPRQDRGPTACSCVAPCSTLCRRHLQRRRPLRLPGPTGAELAQRVASSAGAVAAVAGAARRALPRPQVTRRMLASASAGAAGVVLPLAGGLCQPLAAASGQRASRGGGRRGRRVALGGTAADDALVSFCKGRTARVAQPLERLHRLQFGALRECVREGGTASGWQQARLHAPPPPARLPACPPAPLFCPPRPCPPHAGRTAQRRLPHPEARGHGHAPLRRKGRAGRRAGGIWRGLALRWKARRGGLGGGHTGRSRWEGWAWPGSSTRRGYRRQLARVAVGHTRRGGSQQRAAALAALASRGAPQMRCRMKKGREPLRARPHPTICGEGGGALHCRRCTGGHASLPAVATPARTCTACCKVARKQRHDSARASSSLLAAVCRRAAAQGPTGGGGYRKRPVP